jgi:hypothetical protein
MIVVGQGTTTSFHNTSSLAYTMWVFAETIASAQIERLVHPGQL